MFPAGGMGKYGKAFEDMQKKLQKLDLELKERVVEAASGGGMVKVVMDGQKNLKSLRIDPEAVNKEDVEMLQDLVTAAINEAARKVDEALADKIGGLTAGLKMPGLF